jgi:tetratricopeptide (TPR) repeat protein
MIGWFKRRPDVDARNIVGNIVFGDVNGSLVQLFLQGAPPAEPALPWRQLPADFDPFRFLSWRTRLVPLIGREAALTSLAEWAEQGAGVKARFLTGAGGTGKSRLAAELAAKLKEKKWSAGFAPLDKPAILPLPREGLLWIADYPEENHDTTQALLRALARVEETPTAIRLLLLSRRNAEWWQADVDAAHAADICDSQDTKVSPLDVDDTVTLYRLTYERVVKHLELIRSPIDESAIQLWWSQQPALHGLPLFSMAAAMHGAVEGNAFPTLAGGEIVRALVRRERLRMDNLGRSTGFANFGLSRLIGLAAIPGNLLADDVRQFADPALEIGTPATDRILDSLDAVPWWENHCLPGLTPDLLAAELLIQILSDRPDRATAWLSAAILRSSPQWVGRIERLAYDITRIHGPQENRLSGWLEQIADIPAVPMEVLQPLLLEPSHSATLPLAVRVVQVFAGDTQADDESRATWLHNGSTILASAGDWKGALDLIEKAVDISRGVVADGTSEHFLNLASNLDSLSNRLNEANKLKEAVAASSEAVSIIAQAVDADLASEEKALKLANALNNHSAHLSAVGLRNEAIEAIEGAVQLYRQLAQTGTQSAEWELANSLHNLAQLLRDQEGTSALEHAEGAIEILEGLTAENPVRFEPKLAAALRTLSTLKGRTDDKAGALDAARRSVQILEGLNIQQPRRFDSDLAISYEALALRLHVQNESAEALETIQKAIAIWRDATKQDPDRSSPGLARSLDYMSEQLRENEKAQALTANVEAVDRWRQCATEYPQRFKPDLARSLNNLSNLKSANGDEEGGLSAAREAHETIRPLAAEDPARFNRELAGTLMTLHNRLVKLPNGLPFAIMAIAEATDIFRELVRVNPVLFEPQLAQALVRYSVLLDAAGDSRRDRVAQEAGEVLERLTPREPGQKFRN